MKIHKKVSKYDASAHYWPEIEEERGAFLLPF